MPFIVSSQLFRIYTLDCCKNDGSMEKRVTTTLSFCRRNRSSDCKLPETISGYSSILKTLWEAGMKTFTKKQGNYYIFALVDVLIQNNVTAKKIKRSRKVIIPVGSESVLENYVNCRVDITTKRWKKRSGWSCNPEAFFFEPEKPARHREAFRGLWNSLFFLNNKSILLLIRLDF